MELTLTHEEFEFLLDDFSNNGQEEVRRVFYKYLSMEATIEDEECRRLANHFATLIPYSLEMNKALSAQRLKKVDSLLSQGMRHISFGRY